MPLPQSHASSNALRESEGTTISHTSHVSIDSDLSGPLDGPPAKAKQASDVAVVRRALQKMYEDPRSLGFLLPPPPGSCIDPKLLILTHSDPFAVPTPPALIAQGKLKEMQSPPTLPSTTTSPLPASLSLSETVPPPLTRPRGRPRKYQRIAPKSSDEGDASRSATSCAYCHSVKKGCDLNSPCGRCVSMGRRPEQCVPRALSKRAGRRRKQAL